MGHKARWFAVASLAVAMGCGGDGSDGPQAAMDSDGPEPESLWLAVGYRLEAGADNDPTKLPPAVFGAEDARQWRPRGFDLDMAPIGTPRYGAGLYVVTGPRTIAHSADADAWEQVQGEAPGDLRFLQFEGNSFVAVTGDAGILFSRDGDTWRPANLPLTGFIEVLAAGGGWFVMLVLEGDRRVVYRSSDGENWSSSPLPPHDTLRPFLTHVDGRFFLTGARNVGGTDTTVLFHGADGEQWAETEVQIASDAAGADIASVLFKLGEHYFGSGELGLYHAPSLDAPWTAITFNPPEDGDACRQSVHAYLVDGGDALTVCQGDVVRFAEAAFDVATSTVSIERTSLPLDMVVVALSAPPAAE